MSGDHLGLSGGQNPCYNVVKPPRFRVGGKTERMLNKTQVKEFLSEHFVGKVNKFLGLEFFLGTFCGVQLIFQGNSSNSVKLDYVLESCSSLRCSHSCIFNYTLLKQVRAFYQERIFSRVSFWKSALSFCFRLALVQQEWNLDPRQTVWGLWLPR